MPKFSGLSEFLARRTLIWALLALPAGYIAVLQVTDQLSYGETIQLSGQWSVGFLCMVLLVTPLKQLLPGRKEVKILLRHRRALGVASFGYALLHTVVYLEKKWPAGLVLKEGQDPSLLTGWVAFLVFLALAVTSNNISVQKLGYRWKTLHRSVYAAAALIFAHWALTSLDPTIAIGIGAAIFLIELTRMRR